MQSRTCGDRGRAATSPLQRAFEGESLLNDATGLVILRFAVIAAAGGMFSAGPAIGRFVVLVVGGCFVGFAVGAL